jgi:hypothetical protein
VAFAGTPDVFPELMAAAIERRDAHCVVSRFTSKAGPQLPPVRVYAVDLPMNGASGCVDGKVGVEGFRLSLVVSWLARRSGRARRFGVVGLTANAFPSSGPLTIRQALDADDERETRVAEREP